MMTGVSSGNSVDQDHQYSRGKPNLNNMAIQDVPMLNSDENHLFAPETR